MIVERSGRSPAANKQKPWLTGLPGRSYESQVSLCETEYRERYLCVVVGFHQEITVSDLVSSVSTAITLAKRLKDIGENIKGAEFKNVLADLTLELADVKLKLADVLEENVRLKNEIAALKNVEGDPCPKCRKRGWQLESSRPDPVFGELGGLRMLFRCNSCGYSEDRLDTPK